MESILAGFEDSMDEFEFNDEYDIAVDELARYEYPVTLTAHNSNWRGQTGTSEATSPDDVMFKLSSFNGTYQLLDVEGELEFRVWTHDRPTGFTVTIEELVEEE